MSLNYCITWDMPNSPHSSLFDFTDSLELRTSAVPLLGAEMYSVPYGKPQGILMENETSSIERSQN